MENDPVFEAHQQLGFPPFSKAQQAQMLLSNDFGPIRDLVPQHRYPLFSGLIRQYITLSKAEFEVYLRQSDYLLKNQNMYKNHPQRDGMWIRSKPQGFEIIWQERGHIDEVEIYADLDALYQRLCDLIYERFGIK
jgi:hypothetical protein